VVTLAPALSNFVEIMVELGDVTSCAFDFAGEVSSFSFGTFWDMASRSDSDLAGGSEIASPTLDPETVEEVKTFEAASSTDSISFPKPLAIEEAILGRGWYTRTVC
jgi:hypothetical protein